jgi:hypothetical protein
MNIINGSYISTQPWTLLKAELLKISGMLEISSRRGIGSIKTNYSLTLKSPKSFSI